MSITEKVKASTDADVARLAARVVELEYQLAMAKEVLEMVRDADNDCARDGVPSIPNLPRAFIDRAITTLTKPARP